MNLSRRKKRGTMRVLGIDPGTGRCGFGVVEKRGNQIIPINYGVIEAIWNV